MQTRFPPEPNGYLHIGHAKAICLDFGLAAEFGGKCNLRMDDTNPSKEETEYVDSIQEDVRWLGFDWGDRLFYASDYFDQLYEWAVQLIKAGKAYVCDLTAEQIREYRGTLTEPGKESPWRNRSVEENLDLFARMKNGEFPDGSRTLRAKIDMASKNLNMRDPVMYRIAAQASSPDGRHSGASTRCTTTRTASRIRIEGVTHSICTLEFEDHRPLYNWYIEQLGHLTTSQQIEFDRLNLTYTLLSKRKLLTLVQDGLCQRLGRSADADHLRESGAADTRRKRSATSARSIGVSKTNGITQLRLLEHYVREDLNKRAARVMAVLRPLRVVIDNYPGRSGGGDGRGEQSRGSRARVRARFRSRRCSTSSRKTFVKIRPSSISASRRAAKSACAMAISSSAQRGERRCAATSWNCIARTIPRLAAATRPDGRKVKSTIHWVSAAHAVDAEVRLYDTLFTKENPNRRRGRAGVHGQSESRTRCEVLTGCKVEPSLRDAASGQPVSVRAAGLLLRGQGFHVQTVPCSIVPWPARRVGQDRAARKISIDDHSRTWRHPE